jgi:hypothetical protein
MVMTMLGVIERKLELLGSNKWTDVVGYPKYTLLKRKLKMKIEGLKAGKKKHVSVY